MPDTTAMPGTEAMRSVLNAPLLHVEAVALRKWAVERALAMSPTHLGGASVDKVIEHAGKIEAWVLGGKPDA